MGTKNNPGRYDCYANAEPDEPIFVLRGSDTTASVVVHFWRLLKEEMKEQGASNISAEKLEEARACALAMAQCAKEKGKDPKQALDAMVKVLERMKSQVSPG